MEPRSVGDVLSGPFDLYWIHRQGVIKALWVHEGLFVASIVWAEAPSDRCCRVCLIAPKQLGPVIGAHWRWHHWTSVRLTHLPHSGFVSWLWHMLRLGAAGTGKRGMDRTRGRGVLVESRRGTRAMPRIKGGEVRGGSGRWCSLTYHQTSDRCDASVHQWPFNTSKKNAAIY